MGADITKFAYQVEHILLFSEMTNLVWRHSLYVQACMRIFCSPVESGITGLLNVVTSSLSNEYKILLHTLVCCMTSNAGERLIIKLFHKYEDTHENNFFVWQNTINDSICPDIWRIDLFNTTIFGYIIQKGNDTGKPYSLGKTGAFTLLRYVVMHAGDCTVSWALIFFN